MAYPVMPLGFLGSQGDNDTYRIERSLRFNSADSAFLSRTPASAGNRKTWTWSGWAKRSNLSTPYPTLFGCGTQDFISFAPTTDNFDVWVTSAGTANPALRTTAVFRDVSSWYHIVLSVDTTQATASNRIRLYVNGSEITSFSSDLRSSITQNVDLANWNTAISHSIGRYASSAGHLDGYLTEINFIDGQALTPSSFGETDAITGRWKAKAYSGTYGTNGFYLKFADNSGTTATTLGKDSSGNGNNWTPNNFSVTAGTGNDSLVDSPTNYGTDTGVGGEVRGNYCTLNSIRYGSGSVATMSDGNLYFANSGNAGTAIGTFAIPSTGKWYWEAVVPTQTYNFMMVGVVKDQELLSNLNSAVGILSSGYAVYSSDGKKYNNNVGSNYMGVNNQNTVMTIAYDANTGSLYVGAGGSWANGSGATNQTWSNAVAAYTGITGTVYPAISFDTGNCYINFGQRPFAYTAPSGFKALCTTNLPQPTIQKPSKYMDVVTYTGNGSARSITGLGFSPDLVWIKSRANARSHRLADTVRGAGKELFSNETSAELTNDAGGYVSAFNSDGFTIGTGAGVNNSGETYVAWAWDEAPIAGMDIVAFTAPSGTSQSTVAHSLGVAPKMIIVKDRNNGATNWPVFHASVCDTTSKFLRLNTTDALGTFSTIWGANLPTASVFGVTGSSIAASGSSCIAYLFAEVEGFSKFGSYTGNGSADGPFVWCGFRPRWVLCKGSSIVSNWVIYDTQRNTFNVVNNNLYPALDSAEDTSAADIDILSNGFKFREGSALNPNTSGDTYIFAAFAESPFKYARAR